MTAAGAPGWCRRLLTLLSRPQSARPDLRQRAVGPKRIALLGAFGVGNLGNDGSLEAMVLHLRRAVPDAELTCICQGYDMVPIALGLQVMSWGRAPLGNGLLRAVNRLMRGLPQKALGPVRALWIMRRFHRAIVPGTGALDDFGERPRGVPYIILQWSLAARLTGCRLAMVSIGAGPIRNRLSRMMLLLAARCASYLSFRDTTSRDFVANHGFALPKDIVFPDLAFGLPMQACPPRPRGEGPPAVGLGVMYYKGWTNADPAIYTAYVGKLAHFTVWLLRGGHAVRLMIGEDSDERAVRDVTAAVTGMAGAAMAAQIRYDAAHSLHDVTAQMASVDVAVATRFHNVACGLMAGTPIISLSYGEKNNALLRDCGLEGFYAHVEHFTTGWLEDRFDRMTERRDEFAGMIVAQVARYRAELARQEERLLGEFLKADAW
jgi:polysaccharide pyruvyl transferase WcaK-like protein